MTKISAMINLFIFSVLKSENVENKYHIFGIYSEDMYDPSMVQDRMHR